MRPLLTPDELSRCHSLEILTERTRQQGAALLEALKRDAVHGGGIEAGETGAQTIAGGRALAEIGGRRSQSNRRETGCDR